MTETGSDLDIAVAAADQPRAPELPPSVDVELPGLGTIPVRDLAGPDADAPVVVLLHGWTATADLNFFTCYRALAEHYRVIAFDHRGHGRGLRARKTFKLEDCADDVMAVLDVLGVDTVTPFGYSMGGTVAQLLWRRHPYRVDGLVLGATAPYFAGKQAERLSFMGLTGLAALARVTPAQARSWLTDQFYLQRKDWGEWAIEQASQHDWRMILEAGRAIGEFSSTDWIGDIDVPTSVIVTMRDTVVPLRRQVRLFEGIAGSDPFRIDGGHDAIVNQAGRFVPQLLRAIASVTGRRAARQAQ
ncbi:MAG TPA: alpha/beta hydrolase [Ilumatobacter sp.]|nr:alpha/beta hydrolase [Ilumatobacter sp.]